MPVVGAAAPTAAVPKALFAPAAGWPNAFGVLLAAGCPNRPVPAGLGAPKVELPAPNAFVCGCEVAPEWEYVRLV